MTKVKTRTCTKCKGEMYLGNDDIYYCTNCDHTVEKRYRKRISKDVLGHIFKVK